ncbi:hematopoietic prostaglandin D synthase-like [Portunus trituberculatus]|nr:hematopoietic prostaglandin D synthase-like [Portunus trituberculatus]XP_045104814.1 hematopoietic prostaglandin D synthase-like [Portunus trituberculatus]
MPQYKLIYFDARGRAELTRWIFAYGGIDYVDERIKKEDWPERKKSIFSGKVPVLMVDDTTVPESRAIARYAAKLAGLYPDDDLDAALSDAICDKIADTVTQIYKIRFSEKTEEEKKKEFEEDLYPNVMKPFLERLEKWLTNKEWFVPNKPQISWADLCISQTLGTMLDKAPEKLEPYPTVLAHVQKVREIPSIKNWIETSPQTQF